MIEAAEPAGSSRVPAWIPELEQTSLLHSLNVFTHPAESLETNWNERDCLASVLISVLTSLYVAFPIYQLLNQQRGVWMVIIINIALGHCSSPFHGFLCILINVTPVGKIPQQNPEYSVFSWRTPTINSHLSAKHLKRRFLYGCHPFFLLSDIWFVF